MKEEGLSPQKSDMEVSEEQKKKTKKETPKNSETETTHGNGRGNKAQSEHENDEEVGCFFVVEVENDEESERENENENNKESDNEKENDEENENDEEGGWQKEPGCVGGFCRDCHCKVAILSLCLISLAAMKLLCFLFEVCPAGWFFRQEVGPPIWFLIVFFTTLGLYLKEALTSHSFRYLCNTQSKEAFMEHLECMYSTPPQIRWRIQCYHLETRTRVLTHTDADGNVSYHTSTYEVRVDTHSASQDLSIERFVDVSNREDHKDIFAYPLTKVSFKLDWCGDANCLDQKFDFIRRNNVDASYDFAEEIIIPGWKDRVLFSTEKPGCAVLGYYLLCHATIFLAYPYRMWLSSITGKVRHVISKEVYGTQLERLRR